MIRIHHLKYSRSTRVIWLMEELGLPYDMTSYDRDPVSFRAPDSLKAIHPLGKAPAIEDGDLTLTESGAIIEHIVDTYGGGRLAPARGDREYAKYLEWLHFAEGSAMLPVVITLVGGMTGGLPDGLKGFVGPELKATFAYLQTAVSPDRYLLDSGFSAADIQMSYVVEAARMGGMLVNYPELAAYLERLERRPAYRRAIEKGGPVALPLSG
jgi:glutathione S-transferase